MAGPILSDGCEQGQDGFRMGVNRDKTDSNGCEQRQDRFRMGVNKDKTDSGWV
ncbi:MAG: hypothetical protein ACOYBD_04475 [Bilifractor sp.]